MVSRQRSQSEMRPPTRRSYCADDREAMVLSVRRRDPYEYGPTPAGKDATVWDRRRSIAEAGSPVPSRLDPRVIGRYRLPPAGHLFERYRLCPLAPCRHHHSEHTIVDQVRAGAAQARRQQTVGRRRRAAPLDVPEDRDAGFESRERLELTCQAERIARLVRLDGRDARDGGLLLLRIRGGPPQGSSRPIGRGGFAVHGTLGDGHNAETGTAA